MLEFRNLTLKRRHRNLCEGLNITLKKGACLVIHGSNGSGKTTLIQALLGQITPEIGQILLDDHPMSTLNTQERKQFMNSVGMVSQWPHVRLLDTIRKTVAHPESDNVQEERILKFIELDQRSRQLVKDLSYAEQRRLDLGRSLVHQPKLLLWDEPFLGLDEYWKKKFLQALKELQDLGTTMVIASVDPGAFAALKDQEMVKLVVNG